MKPFIKPIQPTTQQPSPTIAAQLTNLSTLSTEALWVLWDQHFETRPHYPVRQFVESRIAYKLQELAFGALSPVSRQRLIALGAQDSLIAQAKQTKATSTERLFAPGTVFIREWGERRHEVVVNGEGRFVYEGLTFKSLTAVARHITGTPWSGPLFFGVK